MVMRCTYVCMYHCSLFLTVSGSPQNVQISLHQDVYNITWNPVDAPSVFYRVSHNIAPGYVYKTCLHMCVWLATYVHYIDMSIST